jgi:hypothetical protein
LKNRLLTTAIGVLGGIFVTLLFVGISFADGRSAEKESLQEKITMAKISLGNHSALRAPHSLQEKIRKFYRDVLGCEITKTTDDVDYFRMGDNFFVAVLYEDGALSEPEWLKSIWLEINADDVLAA